MWNTFNNIDFSLGNMDYGLCITCVFPMQHKQEKKSLEDGGYANMSILIICNEFKHVTIYNSSRLQFTFIL